MANTVVRKAGDTLFLGGTLSVTGGPAVPWTGATARINIRTAERMVNPVTGALLHEVGALVVDNALVTTFDINTLAWTYNGTPIANPGVYTYEIEVTYADATIETFPNNEDIPLTVLPAVG